MKSTYKMSEAEICREYRNAKNPNPQLQILADLNGIKRIEVIKILAKNGEKLPKFAVNQLYKRLSVLEEKIEEEEQEHRAIVQALKAIKY